MRWTVLASVALVVVGAVGCGAAEGDGQGEDDPAGQVGGTSAPASTSNDPGSAVAPKIEPERQPGEARIVEGSPLPSERIDGSELPRDYPRKVHVLAGGTSLAIVAREAGCSQVAAEVTEQTPRHVVVVLVETMPAAADACTRDLRFPTVTVSLAEPLGQRDVVLQLRLR